MVTSTSAPASRARRTRRDRVLEPVGHDAEIDHLGALARATAPSARSRWNRRSGRARARCRAAPVRRRSRARRPSGARCTGTVGWFIAAASARSRPVRRRPLVQAARRPCVKSSPAPRTCLPARRRASLTMTRVAVARGVLLDDDGVGAVRQHAAGEDARGFAGADRRRRTDARPRLRRSPSACAGALATSAARTA